MANEFCTGHFAGQPDTGAERLMDNGGYPRGIDGVGRQLSLTLPMSSATQFFRLSLRKIIGQALENDMDS